MDAQPSPSPPVELLLANLQRSLEVGMVRIQGDLTLVLQRLDQSDARHADLAKRVDELEDRQITVEKGAVTKDDQSRGWNRGLGLVSVMVAAAGLMVTAVTSVIALLQ